MERLLGQAAWNAAKQMTKEKIEDLKDFLIHKGKGMKRISIPVYVPEGAFCCDKENIPCMYYDNHRKDCTLGLGRPITDECGRVVKPKMCKEL